MAHLISWRTRLIPANGYSIRSIFQRRLNITHCRHYRMPALTHDCEIYDIEPLYRYKPGGYHPLELGDTLKNGRYKILHKLGWGGFSTTWAAKDHTNGCYVAVKVKVSDAKDGRELDILKALSGLPTNHPGSSYINRMLDHFTLVGPNGSHECLVLELVGPSVSDVANDYKDGRIPAKLVKHVAKQTLRGIDYLAVNGIAHGDLHTKNVALKLSGLETLSEEDFVTRLGKPETGAVRKNDGGPLGTHVPTEMTRPASFEGFDYTLPSPSVKIIDFGEAFFDDNPPKKLNTPTALRAPEIAFEDRLDRRVDLWSAGCLIFELVTGQPPFCVFQDDHSGLVRQMVEAICQEPPARWQDQWHTMKQEEAKRDAEQNYVPEENETFTLHEFLRECYCFDEKKAEFTDEELARIAEAIGSMMRFEPSLRATPSEMLANDLFQ